jgi:hypothetical protein
MSNDPFGFSLARPKSTTARQVASRITEIAPETQTSPDPPVAKIDRIAEELGFTSREPAASEETIIRRRRDVGPTAQLNVKCPVPVYNRFVRFCDEERLTYWEGIARLLDLVNADHMGRRSQ